MKTTSAKKTTVTATAQRQAVNQPFFRKAASGPPAAAVAHIQPKLAVSSPGDRFEREADRMADKVMRAGAPAGEERRRDAADGQPPGGGLVQRKENGEASAPAEAGVRAASTGGRPLDAGVRGFMEPRFGADFGNVRIHDDAGAAALSNQLGARAFTYGSHIFFARDQYQPASSDGKQLLAHELTHTIQQGHAVQRKPQVSPAPPSIQGFGLQDGLDYFARQAEVIPGFRLLCVILGVNPINQRSVERSAANVLRALVELLPGGVFITRALDRHGVFEKAGAWVEKQLATLGDFGGEIVGALDRFIKSLSWTDLTGLGGVWERAKAIFTAPIKRLLAFGASVVGELMAIVREALLRPLAALAKGTAGYDLLCAVLGQDPITGEPVPRTASTLIGGFMKLIGQEEVWENIQKGHAVERAWAWFQGALAGLMGFVRSVPGRIVETLASITWEDVLTVAGVFVKVGKSFLNLAGEFISWAGAQVLTLLEIIFSVVAPGVLVYIGKARAAFNTIIKDPVRFVGNLVRAGKRGFELFATNIGEHLKAALIKWLVGPLGEAGVYIPKSFSLMEIVKLVLSVLGLTWQNIRSKLVKIIPEPVLVALEKTAGILVTLVKDGPAAAWEQIKAELAELKDMLIAKVTEMVATEVVKAAVVKLVSMLNPAGAVIQAIIAIYKTVTFFIEKINQIAAVVASFIDSIAAIAAGQVEGAAKKVESTMANTLTVIVAFLAKLVGLGNVPEKLVGIVKKIRAPIDKGLDKIVAWLGKMLEKAKQAAAAVLEWWKARKVFKNASGESHTLSFKGTETDAVLTIESTPVPLTTYLAGIKDPDPVQAAAIAAIREKVQAIQDRKTRFGKREGTSSFSKADGEAISKLFEEIALLLAKLGSGAPPKTKVHWEPGASGEDGVEMVANPLSVDSGGYAGSQPRGESKLWKRVNKVYPGQFVRGHLLNHHLHGEGTIRNLIPITREANSLMERIAESDVKRAVLAENKVVRYSVKMVAFQTAPAGYPEFGQLPRTIHIRADQIEPKPDGQPATIVNKDISSTLPPLPQKP